MEEGKNQDTNRRTKAGDLRITARDPEVRKEGEQS